ncbi:ATP-grasp domain-containing protein [Nakamurella endophytica]|uniref:ATP-grasp domain-containing protein n=1 Tax=Nakamurella endophytica TaxID=1748367 RepID=A0A917T7I7_9ACTN|nr:ATP-grasp domain-containing protein [Nakamurella endophytica]GGM12496.1 hypothetical protein GCM10011594_35480 [Nakamurella endophytica]
MDVDRLVLYARHADTAAALAAAAERLHLAVVPVTADPESVVRALSAGAAERTAIRAPGGLVAAALSRGAPVELAGPTPAWFAGLDAAVTGRRWMLCDPATAAAELRGGPRFVKPADAKLPDFPAQRMHDPGELARAVAAVGAGPGMQLLVTAGWLRIDSEYRVFCCDRQVAAASAYRVQDEPWSPLLHTHRASFHVEAAAWAAGLLRDLPDAAVPPAAALDVARLDDGRFVLLEANNAWSAGPYGCDPDGVLRCVLAARPAGLDDPFRWRPDPALP